jgi:hypothetical protein
MNSSQFGYLQLTRQCENVTLRRDASGNLESITYGLPPTISQSIHDAVETAAQAGRCFPILLRQGAVRRHLGIYVFEEREFCAGRLKLTVKRVAAPLESAEPRSVELHALLPVRCQADIVLGHGNLALDLCLDCIDTALQTLRITLYQLDHRGFEAAVVRAVERGVAVQCALQQRPPPAVLIPDSWLPLMGHGLDLRLVANLLTEDGRHPPGALHAKLQIADAACAVLTSLNPTSTGASNNIEHAVRITDAPRVASIVAQFDSLWARLTPSGEESAVSA